MDAKDFVKSKLKAQIMATDNHLMSNTRCAPLFPSCGVIPFPGWQTSLMFDRSFYASECPRTPCILTNPKRALNEP